MNTEQEPREGMSLRRKLFIVGALIVGLALIEGAEDDDPSGIPTNEPAIEQGTIE